VRAWLSEACAARHGMRQVTAQVGLFLSAPGDEAEDAHEDAYDQAKNGDAASNLSRLRAGARYEPIEDDFDDDVHERLERCDWCGHLRCERAVEWAGVGRRRCRDRDECALSRGVKR